MQHQLATFLRSSSSAALASDISFIEKDRDSTLLSSTYESDEHLLGQIICVNAKQQWRKDKALWDPMCDI